MCGAGLLLALNTVSVFEGVEPGVYFLALFIHFLGAAFFFIRLLTEPSQAWIRRRLDPGAEPTPVSSPQPAYE